MTNGVKASEVDVLSQRRAVLQAAKDLKKPPYTVAELLHVLREQGAKTTVSRPLSQPDSGRSPTAADGHNRALADGR